MPFSSAIVPTHPTDHSHFVQFYEHDEHLIESVARFISEGLQVGEPAVIIVTPQHKAGIEKALQKGKHQFHQAIECGGFVALDAADTLSLFMVNGMPNAARFVKHVGDVISRAPRMPGKQVRAFGEMVALLWKDGNAAAAIALEELWNELAEQYSFSLFCAYPLDQFKDASNSTHFNQICKAHSHVLQSNSYLKHSDTDRFRQIAALEQKAAALEAEVARRQEIEAQLRRRESELKDAAENAAAQLADSQLLQRISSEMFFEQPQESLYEKLVDAAVAIMRSDFASMQMFCPEREENGALLLLATRGFSPEAAEGWKWVSHKTPSSCGEVLRRGERVIASDIEECPFLDLVAYRGAGIKAMQSTPLLSRSGKLVGMISTHWRRQYTPTERDLRLFDILARQAADLIERNRAVDELRNAEQALREADRRKNEFLATLAHELRNPLAPIRSALDLQRLRSAGQSDSDQLQQIMERQVRQLTRLVDDLLEVSRINSGKIVLRKEPVDLTAVIESAVDASNPLIEKAHHQLTVSLPRDPLIVHADPMRLSQVLVNLLNNASKYTPDGGKITVSAIRQANDVIVTIRDTGMGIPTHMLPRVFDMFAQVDRTLNRSQGGLGIGLSLAKKLAELHGGRIEARSDGAGKGSEFIVTLPYIESAPAMPPGLAAIAGIKPATAKKRVLIVDDNKDAARSLAMLLGAFAHTTRLAFDGDEALRLAEEFQPDVILMDIGMPKLDGYQAARSLRSMESTRNIRLVALSGWGQEEDRKKATESGFDHHFTKPVDINQIMRLLDAG